MNYHDLPMGVYFRVQKYEICMPVDGEICDRRITYVRYFGSKEEDTGDIIDTCISNALHEVQNRDEIYILSNSNKSWIFDGSVDQYAEVVDFIGGGASAWIDIDVVLLPELSIKQGHFDSLQPEHISMHVSGYDEDVKPINRLFAKEEYNGTSKDFEDLLKKTFIDSHEFI